MRFFILRAESPDAAFFAERVIEQSGAADGARPEIAPPSCVVPPPRGVVVARHDADLS